MKISIISSLNGGIGTFTVELVNAISPFVDEINLYLFFSNPLQKVPIFPDNVKIIVYTNSPLKLIFFLFKNIKKLTKSNIIHLNYSSFFIIIFFIKIIWGIPYIITSHGIPQPELEKGLMKFYYNIEQKLLKLSSIFSNCHIAISYYVKNQLLLKYGINSLVIYHGISYNNQEKLSIIQKQDIRKFLGLPKEKFIILYVGKMNKYKNILTLINSIPLIISSYNNILFILIGSGDLLEEVKQKIIKFNITSYVILIPFSNNLSKYYMIADAFILPSKNEMFGIVLLEAMSHGLPVIASNGGACPEIIGDAGLLFNPDNCKELADTILLLLNDDNLKVTLKSQSLKRAKLFSWDITVNQYLEVYMRNMKI